MSNYTKATNFTAKDSLPAGNAAKVVMGAELDDEFDAIAVAIATKANTASPTFTGTPAAPTAAVDTNTTQVATTAYVVGQGYAKLAGAAFTGNVTTTAKFVSDYRTTGDGGDEGQVTIKGVAGQARGITFTTQDASRFTIGISSNAESGSNAGSEFSIWRYADNGAYLGNPVVIYRATGLVQLNSGVTVANGLTVSSGTATFSGTLSLGRDYTETVASSTGNTTIDLANGTVFIVTTNGNNTITLPSSAAGKSYLLFVKYTGAHTITWAGGSTIKWTGGSAPSQTKVNGKADIFSFICDGTSTYGQAVGLNY